MAKKTKIEFAVSSLADLAADAANPRKISDEALTGLGNSLDKFGDLSGIVFNKRTGELVAGHQRLKQINERWPDATIEPVDEENGRIVVEEGKYFAVRIVDWTRGKQRAANVTANNQKIAGKFTKDVSQFLLEVEAEISAEMPGVFDDCLLTEVMAAGIDLSTNAEDTSAEADSPEVDIKESFQVVVECADEADQKAVYDELVEKGYKCRVLTV